VIDVAIIGGGVAGCYSAYRLAQSSAFRNLQLFEMSDRIGGRLWSVPFDAVAYGSAELGGMFFCDDQENVLGLIDEELTLPKEPVDFQRKHQYLRSKLLLDSTYADRPASIPYFLNPAETGLNPERLLVYTLKQIVPDILTLWPKNKNSTPRATMDYLRAFQLKGRPLHDWGFWNLISDVLSNEAYDLLISTLGTASTFRNANAFDSIWNILAETSSNNWYRLVDGYQELPLTLAKRCADKVKFNKSHRLVRMRQSGHGVALDFEKDDGERLSLKARNVILALPRRALELIRCDDALFADTSFYEDLNAVVPIEACKLLLKFPFAWWTNTKLGTNFLDPTVIGAGFTDLPMRQCYYYAKPKNTEAALLMATYADDVAASYWSGLVSSRYEIHSRSWRVNGEDELCASKAMVEAALAQLRLMHKGVTIPPPIGALFFDWLKDPYGAAWHTWAPYYKSWETIQRIRKPNPKVSIFVCGEAIAQTQGWTEGAINSAEQLLEQYFDLDRPTWVTSSYVFEF
jgi:monoamine oxidase